MTIARTFPSRLALVFRGSSGESLHKSAGLTPLPACFGGRESASLASQDKLKGWHGLNRFCIEELRARASGRVYPIDYSGVIYNINLAVFVLCKTADRHTRVEKCFSLPLHVGIAISYPHAPRAIVAENVSCLE